MNKEAMFSSKKSDWETPKDFFRKINKEFNFTLDPCATITTAKTDKYFTKDHDGLTQSWEDEVVFCNPPYGREITDWVRKAFMERHRTKKIVMLLPARTDTKWFHSYIYNKAEIRFIKGRLKFEGAEHSAPFPSMLVIYDNSNPSILSVIKGLFSHGR